MKKTLSIFAGTVLAMTTTFSAFAASPAFADDGGDHGDGWSSHVTAQSNFTVTPNSTFGNLPVLPPLGLGNHHQDSQHEEGHSENGHEGHGQKNQKENEDSNKPESSEHHAPEGGLGGQGNLNLNHLNTSNHGANVAQLHQELAVYHQDVLAAQAAHRSLTQAAKDFVTAMQDAVAAGDTAAIQTGTTQAQSIIDTLKQALTAQAQADAQATASTTAANKGDLASALTAIHNAEAREVAKTTAMTTAAKDLEALAAQIETQVASTSTTSTGNTTSGTTNSTNSTNSTNTTTSNNSTTTNSTSSNTTSSSNTTGTNNNSTGN